MKLIDSHAHLDDKRFDADRLQVIERAVQNKLQLIINAGHDLESSQRSIALAAQYPFIYATVGVHPHDAKNVPADYLQQLEAMASQPKVVAIGEIGLDYYYDHSPREVQREVFLAQLRLAKKLNLPVAIHLRDAYGDFLEIMRQEKLSPIKGVMHCFSGSGEVAKECLDMGFYISFAGPVTFKNADKLKQVAAGIPMDKILIETDCPYLTPTPYRGKRNEPAYVQHVAEEIALLKNTTATAVAEAVWHNAMKLFNLSLGGEQSE